MKLTLQMQLLPSAEQKAVLLATMERFNAAATFAARTGFNAGVFSQPSIHKLAYAAIRERFGLSAQMAVRAIGKAVEVFKRDKFSCPQFKPHGAVTYDERILSFKGLDKVSLWTLAGRLLIPMIYGDYQRERFDRIKGQADLVYRDGKFFLYATVDFAEPPPVEPTDWLGVDLGIVNLATASTGQTFSGETVQRNRRRRATARKQHQRKGTRNAKRKLRRMAGRQARFQRWMNHTIAKRLVEAAKAQSAGIVLEDLRHIRSRIEDTVTRRFRQTFGNWSFAHLRQCIEYKARQVGIPVLTVDPYNTSRTCSRCGHCERGNRPDQATFRCLHCHYSSHADHNAACNLARLGRTVSRPQKTQVACLLSTAT